MKTNRKVWIDRITGKPLVVFLNVMARALGAVLRIDHGFSKPPSTIVVCKYLGMGSIIQSTPLLLTLKKNFSKAKIIFLTSAGNKKLMQMIPAVDETLTVDDSSFSKIFFSTIKVLFKLWRRKPGLFIDLETYSYYSTAVATMSCARNRFGFYRRDAQIRLGVYTHMMFFNKQVSISSCYLQMARLAGCRETENNLFGFPVSENTRQATLQKFPSLKNNYLIINPNASDLRVERRWGQKNYAELINRLAETFPEFILVLIGAKNETGYVSEVKKNIVPQFANKIVDTSGMLSLEELFALIDGSQLLITNDSGPMHIAFALGKKTVTLFGPCSPKQYGGSENTFSIYKNIYCSPCVHDFISPPCNGNNQCMKMIGVDEVFSLCKNILENKIPAENVFETPGIFMNADGLTPLGIVERSAD